MNLAEAWGLRLDGSNPVRHVKKYREDKRERYLTKDELQRLGAVLADAERDNTEIPFTFAAIGLLILTGARLTEILTPLNGNTLTLQMACSACPIPRPGPSRSILTTPRSRYLRGVPLMAGNPYVIAGKKRGARLINLQKPWRRIRAAAGLHNVRIHDLRHSFASIGAGAGMSLAGDRQTSWAIPRQ